MAALNQNNVFEQIQSICREYRKVLKSGQSVSIDEYLSKVDDSARGTLFQNLLHLDIEFCRRRGTDPSSEDYIARFPQYARLIRQAFFESTLMSQDFDSNIAHDDNPTVALGIPAAKRIGEYELIREIGRGGFGVVYEARHLKLGERVALKTLPTLSNSKNESTQDAERLHRFRKEFRSLAEINHPNVTEEIDTL
ncbi:MAG: hypothetical protein AAF664_24715 [Planctomycetota bacterium]